MDGDEFGVAEGSVIRIDPAGARWITADSRSSIRYVGIQTEAQSLVQFTEGDGVILEAKPSWLKGGGGSSCASGRCAGPSPFDIPQLRIGEKPASLEL